MRTFLKTSQGTGHIFVRSFDMCSDLLDEQGRVMINPLMDIPREKVKRDVLHHIVDLGFRVALKF